MLDVRKLLAQRPLLFDGGMGTYYKAKPGQECEQANLTDPEGILAVHRAYLAAGADAIKTNTFSLPRLAAAQQPGWEQLADAGWQLAANAAAQSKARYLPGLFSFFRRQGYCSQILSFSFMIWSRLSGILSSGNPLFSEVLYAS